MNNFGVEAFKFKHIFVLKIINKINIILGVKISNTMLPFSSETAYRTPHDYMPPDETQLANDTDYPNLNSRDYAKRPLNRTLRMHDAWECISINTGVNEPIGNVAIACNKLSGREWSGSMWGFEKTHVAATHAMDAASSCFRLQCPSIINCMEYVTPDMLLLGYNSGKLQVWSTYSEVRDPKNPYCLFKIGDKCEHSNPILCLATYKHNSPHAITGCKKGTIKLWNMGTADLMSEQTYHFAHTDSITGVAVSPCDANIFSSCSLDKSCLLWDTRETRPAIALYDNHKVRFQAVAWSLQNGSNMLYVGDECGEVLTLDSRNPRQLLESHSYFQRPIRKILPNGDNLAVIGDTNALKISKCSTHSVFYENCESDNFLRDCAWLTDSELLTVGYESTLIHHKIS